MQGYSPIGPIEVLEELDRQEVLGNYILLLPHMVLEAPDRFRKLFHPAYSGRHRFIIMDNSVIELGAAMPTRHMQEACKVVNASCLVLPDVLGDPQATVEASIRAAQNWEGVAPYMAVLQGNNVAELLWCQAQIGINARNIKYWAVPRVVANTMGSRMPILHAMGAMHPSTPCNVHLLGMSQHGGDDLACAQAPGVMGIDSANPCVLGYQGIDITEGTTIPHIDRGDYLENGKVTPEMIKNIEAIRNVIQPRQA